MESQKLLQKHAVWKGDSCFQGVPAVMGMLRVFTLSTASLTFTVAEGSMFTCLPDYLLAADTIGCALQLHDLPTLQIHPMHASSSHTTICA